MALGGGVDSGLLVDSVVHADDAEDVVLVGAPACCYADEQDDGDLADSRVVVALGGYE